MDSANTSLKNLIIVKIISETFLNQVSDGIN